MRSGERTTIIINCDPPSVFVPPTPRAVTTSSGDRGLFIIINREGPGLCQPLPGHKKSIHHTLISHSHRKMITARGESIVDILIVPVCIASQHYDEIWLAHTPGPAWSQTLLWGKGQQGGRGLSGIIYGNTIHRLPVYTSVITRGEFNLTPITGLSHQREQKVKLVQK